MDSTEIGAYGTLHLMKRQQPDVPIAAFPIDSTELTFGCDAACGVRLYYPDVSPLHARLIFEDRKAFLIVLGATGVLVDGCPVFPAPATARPTTVPLSTGSEIEIRTKRFRFSYPPKALRAALATTIHTPRRALRLSMIASAQVFTPRPSADPRANLRVLQSPLRTPVRSEAGAPTEPDIVLVDGDHPRVVEEDSDLVILEDVDVPPPRVVAPPPQTPRRPPRPSLHRAVLIRSAQRAVLRAEIEHEEQMEESEVAAFIAAPVGGIAEEDEEEEEYHENDNDDDIPDGNGDEEDPLASASEEEDEPEEDAKPADKPTWRKSLHAVQSTLWPFRSLSAAPEAKPEPTQEEYIDDKMDVEDADEDEDAGLDENDELAPLAHAPPTPLRARALGPFMTPQHAPVRPAPRLSHGGGEAQRVMVAPTWRVRDIVLPEPIAVKAETAKDELPDGPSTPRATAAEREAIQARRRSALTAPDPFFGGRAPGTGTAAPAPTPVRLKKSVDDEEEMDTRVLLERMRATVEGMQRRRSVAPRASVSPQKGAGLLRALTAAEAEMRAGAESLLGDSVGLLGESTGLEEGAEGAEHAPPPPPPRTPSPHRMDGDVNEAPLVPPVFPLLRTPVPALAAATADASGSHSRTAAVDVNSDSDSDSENAPPAPRRTRVLRTRGAPQAQHAPEPEPAQVQPVIDVAAEPVEAVVEPPQPTVLTEVPNDDAAADDNVPAPAPREPSPVADSMDTVSDDEAPVQPAPKPAPRSRSKAPAAPRKAPATKIASRTRTIPAASGSDEAPAPTPAPRTLPKRAAKAAPAPEVEEKDAEAPAQKPTRARAKTPVDAAPAQRKTPARRARAAAEASEDVPAVPALPTPAPGKTARAPASAPAARKTRGVKVEPAPMEESAPVRRGTRARKGVAEVKEEAEEPPLDAPPLDAPARGARARMRKAAPTGDKENSPQLEEEAVEEAPARRVTRARKGAEEALTQSAPAPVRATRTRVRA